MDHRPTCKTTNETELKNFQQHMIMGSMIMGTEEYFASNKLITQIGSHSTKIHNFWMAVSSNLNFKFVTGKILIE